MKTKVMFFLAASLITINLKGQTYQIHSVEPISLIPGTNVMTVVLDQEITYDSISAAIWVYEGFYVSRYYYGTEISWADSTITLVYDIPNEALNDKGILHIDLINTDDWSYQELIYDDSITIGGGIHALVPEICMVSSDTMNRNMIIWETYTEDILDSIIIYRETEVAESFERIGAVSNTEPPVFTDLEAIQARYSNRYKIACQDTLGNITLYSNPHKTMYLTLNGGFNHSVNLIWEKYEGFNYQTFYIYRGFNKNGMMKIAKIASNLFTFTDLNPPYNKLYYQIVIENPSPCEVSSDKFAEDDYSTCRSNIVEIENSVSLSDVGVDKIRVYPNPAIDHISIHLNHFIESGTDILILDLTGRTLITNTLTDNNGYFDISELHGGTYFLLVRSENIFYKQLFVKL